MEVAVTNYGCAILSIMVPDKDGKYANVVLGHGSIKEVVNSPEPFRQYHHRTLRQPHCQRKIHPLWPRASINNQ